MANFSFTRNVDLIGCYVIDHEAMRRILSVFDEALAEIKDTIGSLARERFEESKNQLRQHSFDADTLAEKVAQAEKVAEAWKAEQLKDAVIKLNIWLSDGTRFVTDDLESVERECNSSARLIGRISASIGSFTTPQSLEFEIKNGDNTPVGSISVSGDGKFVSHYSKRLEEVVSSCTPIYGFVWNSTVLPVVAGAYLIYFLLIVLIDSKKLSFFSDKVSAVTGSPDFVDAFLFLTFVAPGFLLVAIFLSRLFLFPKVALALGYCRSIYQRLERRRRNVYGIIFLGGAVSLITNYLSGK